MWDIWCVGDYKVLADTLNSVSAWAGTGRPAEMAAIGMLISFLIVAIQGVLKGGQMPQYQNIFVGWLFYVFLFGTSASVIVKDVHSVNTRVVDNVPFGIAAVGSIVSNITYNITEDMETAYSLPTMVDDIFSGALQILSNSRNLAFPSKPGAEIGRSVANYLTDCTNTGILRGEINPDVMLRNNPNPLEAIRWDSDVFTTKTFLPSDPTPAPVKTCSEAFSDLKSYFGSATFIADWDAYLEGNFDTEDASSHIQTVLDNLSSGAVDAKHFMLSSATYEMFKSSLQNGAVRFNDPVVAASVAEAIASRDAQAVADAQMFQKIARPGMAFFEVLVYAIAPFLAFLCVIVPLGSSLIVKYLLMGIWVQIWMPSLSLLNYMGNLVMQNKIGALENKGAITSLMGSQDVFMEAQNWLSTINTLAAAVPVVTMFLVSGSMMGFTAIASRMSGSDNFNEKNMSPDVLKNNPVLTSNVDSIQSGRGGFDQQGAVAPTWNLSAQAQSVTRSAQSHALTLGQELFSAMGQAYTTGATQTLSEGTRGSSSTSENYSKLQTTSLINEKANNIAQQYGVDSSHINGLQTALKADLSARLGGGDLPGGGLTATRDFLDKHASGSKWQNSQEQQESLRFSEQDQIAFTKATAADLNQYGETAFTGSYSFKEDEQVGQKASEALSAVTSYEKANSFSSSFSGGVDASANEAGKKAYDKGQQGVLEAASALGLMGRASELASTLYSEQFGSSGANIYQGAFHALWEEAQGGKNPEALEALAKATRHAYGIDINAPDGSASSNADLTENQIKAPKTSVDDVGLKKDMLKLDADLPFDKTLEGLDRVRGNRANGEEYINAKRMASEAEMLKDQESGIRENLDAHLHGKGAAAIASGTYAQVENIVEGVTAWGDYAVGAGATVLESAVNGFKNDITPIMDKLKENPDDASLLDQVSTAVKGVVGAMRDFLGDDELAEYHRGFVDNYKGYLREIAHQKGLEGDEADYFAQQRFNQTVGGGTNERMFQFWTGGSGVTDAIHDHFGTTAGTERGLEQYSYMDPQIREALDAAALYKDYGALSHVRALSDNLDQQASNPFIRTAANQPVSHHNEEALEDPAAAKKMEALENKFKN